jgi:hypothetical protein
VTESCGANGYSACSLSQKKVAVARAAFRVKSQECRNTLVPVARWYQASIQAEPVRLVLDPLNARPFDCAWCLIAYAYTGRTR